MVRRHAEQQPVRDDLAVDLGLMGRDPAITF
jgi:hypothetical protein